MITYDPNCRPTLSPNGETAHRVITDGFKYAYLTKISQEEWHVATSNKDRKCGIQAALDKGVERVVISRGEQGVLGSIDNTQRIASSYPPVIPS
jgi:fructokinase